MLEEGPTIASAERIEPQENSNLVSDYAAVRWLMEIRLTHPKIILTPRSQHKSDGINDGGFAGIILSHQCRDTGRQGQLKRRVPFTESPEVFDPFSASRTCPPRKAR